MKYEYNYSQETNPVNTFHKMNFTVNNVNTYTLTAKVTCGWGEKGQAIGDGGTTLVLTCHGYQQASYISTYNLFYTSLLPIIQLVSFSSTHIYLYLIYKSLLLLTCVLILHIDLAIIDKIMH